jgi:hypothetical protein
MIVEHFTFTEGIVVGIAVGACLIGSWNERRLTVMHRLAQRRKTVIADRGQALRDQAQKIRTLTEELEDTKAERDAWRWHKEVIFAEERAAHPSLAGRVPSRGPLIPQGYARGRDC